MPSLEQDATYFNFAMLMKEKYYTGIVFEFKDLGAPEMRMTSSSKDTDTPAN